MAETIYGPAMQTPEGEVYRLAAPNRHHDVMKHMRASGVDPIDMWGSAQGFWTSEGRYVSREEAWEIADAAKQITHAELARRPRELFTECMW